MSSDAHEPFSFLASDLSAFAGVAFDKAGETDVEGGEAGLSWSNPARRLNAFAEVADSFSFCWGGVPVLDEAPESSPPLLNEPPGPIFRPLLLRDENMDVGPNDICWLAARLVFLLVRRRRSSIPTVFFW